MLRDEGDDVHAEAVDALVEPEAHEAVDLFADFGVVPVEVGLLYGEVVEVVLAGGGVELPGGAGEEGRVVVGWSVGLPSGPAGPGLPGRARCSSRGRDCLWICGSRRTSGARRRCG